MLSILNALTLALSVVSAKPQARQSATLKSAAASSSSSSMGARYFGAALAAGHLSNVSDPNFARVGMEQFSGATPENEMKWYVQLPYDSSLKECLSVAMLIFLFFFLALSLSFFLSPSAYPYGRDATEPEQGVFTFDQADQVASFAVEHGMKLRGHTFVWHRYVRFNAFL